MVSLLNRTVIDAGPVISSLHQIGGLVQDCSISSGLSSAVHPVRYIGDIAVLNQAIDMCMSMTTEQS